MQDDPREQAQSQGHGFLQEARPPRYPPVILAWSNVRLAGRGGAAVWRPTLVHRAEGSGEAADRIAIAPYNYFAGFGV